MINVTTAWVAYVYYSEWEIYYGPDPANCLTPLPAAVGLYYIHYKYNRHLDLAVGAVCIAFISPWWAMFISFIVPESWPLLHSASDVMCERS